MISPPIWLQLTISILSNATDPYISLAQNEIQIRSSAFTSQLIADALVQAHQRGVKVRILCDAQQSQNPHSKIPQLKQAGIVVQSENVRGIAHNKVVIVDARLLITGSYNFTQGAENRNAENLLFLSHPETVQQYLDDWKRAWDNVKVKATNLTKRDAIIPRQNTDKKRLQL